jgi:hypothetical protein
MNEGDFSNLVELPVPPGGFQGRDLEPIQEVVESDESVVIPWGA